MPSPAGDAARLVTAGAAQSGGLVCLGGGRSCDSAETNVRSRWLVLVGGAWCWLVTAGVGRVAQPGDGGQ